ncbi:MULTISPECIES: permease-like cell division protein FtsX [Actinokineospora]|uniref:Cell division protein FtsX n=3 Tax=Actinokineospora TaxID=39845 RepID=A0A9W6QSS8_9PSEU|nr:MULTISPECIES: permease-like cell division protein FtsX [Actinokineospora]MCP2304974.1 cell division transport system permease protein [Actinokineospora globicatena]RLK54214.1 cell division transport system permease protein [Actinokineospora cianjurensis]SES35614.1 cell division transport system permease protein [Actinokineospora terrae]GLW80434.1 cell division protein FtsX [Actinokineospora globicatena]GLW87262.1 cell division protein FtsX [Actinokineospora globicatena]
MRASFVFSEVVTGLRRNITMTIAMIITTAISLLLLGGGLLVVRMIDNTKELYQDKVEVNIYLTNDVSASDKDCKADPCRGLRSQLESDPAVERVEFENRDQAYERFKRIFEAQPELVKLARPEALPSSFNVRLKDPDRPEVIIQTYKGKAGVDSIGDQSQFLDRFFSALNGVRNATFFIAGVMAVAALLLISNTVQLSAFTRRTEVGIMRLVGATRWYTQLPFLLEAVVTGIIGALVAIAMLVGAKLAFLDDVLAQPIKSGVVKSVEAGDLAFVSPILLLIAIGVSAFTGYVTLRLYVRT